jgi:hypothetical protein
MRPCSEYKVEPSLGKLSFHCDSDGQQRSAIIVQTHLRQLPSVVSWHDRVLKSE